MPPSTHTVRRQVLEVQAAGSHADALALQRELAALGSGALAKALEAALDECDPGASYLLIDRIEVSLGVLSRERLAEELADALRRAVALAIRGATNTPPGSPEPDGTGGLVSVRMQGQAQRLEDALAYFLEHGTLPAGFVPHSGASFEQMLLEGWAGDPDRHLARVRAVLADARARTRLVGQFAEPLLEKLALRLAGGRLQIDVARLAEAGAALSGLSLPVCRRRAWEAVFASLAAGGRAGAQAIAATAFGGADHASRFAATAANGLASGTGNPATTTQRAAQSHPDAEDGIFINDAGLVLLHPFIGSLFQRLGLADGARLLAPDRALVLLHHLSTGAPVAPEYELALPKLLCGLPLTQPVEGAVELDAAAVDEARNLLESVIGHWSVLRNTSPDGLRGAFLHRPGKLSLGDDGWRLQVEPQAADFLLDQLPWTLSPIRLPWMERMLWVEWH